MKAQEIYFERFVSQGDTTFVIPVYQRNYDWKKSNCKRLFSDILAIAKDIALGTNYLPLRDLADSSIITPKLFNITLTAMTINRNGVNSK